MINSTFNHKQPRPIHIMQFWGGVPQTPNSRWRQTLRVVEKCSERGWKSTLVLSDRPQLPALMDPFLKAGSEILVHQRQPNTLKLNAIINTYKFLHKHPCDLIHCYNRPAIPLLAAVLNKVPVRIWSKLSMSSSYEEATPPIGIHKLNLNIRLTCFAVNKILCNAQPVLDELIGLLNSITHKSVVMRDGFDLDFYAAGCPGIIRNEFSLSTHNLVLVSVGHAAPVKGWDILIKAYAKFQKYFPQSKLLLVGSTELDGEKEISKLLMHQIETLSLQKNVIFTGKRNDIPDILAGADIYVQPSRSEGFCGSLIEALVAGLPCIASNVGGIPDFLHCGENGLLFEREDINGLTKRMLSIAQNRVLREKLSNNAPFSVQPYQLEAVTDSIINTYKELLTNRGY